MNFEIRNAREVRTLVSEAHALFNGGQGQSAEQQLQRAIEQWESAEKTNPKGV